MGLASSLPVLRAQQRQSVRKSLSSPPPSPRRRLFAVLLPAACSAAVFFSKTPFFSQHVWPHSLQPPYRYFDSCLHLHFFAAPVIAREKSEIAAMKFSPIGASKSPIKFRLLVWIHAWISSFSEESAVFYCLSWWIDLFFFFFFEDLHQKIWSPYDWILKLMGSVSKMRLHGTLLVVARVFFCFCWLISLFWAFCFTIWCLRWDSLIHALLRIDSVGACRAYNRCS